MENGLLVLGKNPELPDAGFGQVFKGLGGTDMQKGWWDKFYLEDLGALQFRVRIVSTGYFWTKDPLLLKGFQCSSSGYVLVI